MLHFALRERMRRGPTGLTQDETSASELGFGGGSRFCQVRIDGGKGNPRKIQMTTTNRKQ